MRQRVLPRQNIERLRRGLDLLLYDCKRYMKRHNKETFDAACKNCKYITPFPSVFPCEVFKDELFKLCKLLIGTGLRNHK